MRDIPNSICLIAYICKRTSPNKEVLGAGERGDPWVPASLLPQMLRQDTQVFKMETMMMMMMVTLMIILTMMAMMTLGCLPPSFQRF